MGVTFAEGMSHDEKADMLKDYLAQFDIEVSRRAERMKSKVRFLKASITRQFTVELMKIPKAVKALTISEFKAALESASSEDEENEPGTVRRKSTRAVRRSTRQSSMRATTGIMSTAKRTRPTNRVSFKPNTSFKARPSRRVTRASTAATEQKQQQQQHEQHVFETPAAVKNGGVLKYEELGFDPRLPKTPYVRQARNGESLLSINGSPVSIDTSCSRIRKGGRDTIITLPLKGGKAVEINSENPDTLADMLQGKDRDEAVGELQRLQAQLSAMIQTFQQQV
ncbi:hypothetical protein PTSG_09134 [Salpingoeca rosetta]|uniref:Uncharacterized protein n=1 Tax=Salpingoeca rosetta (strain ATCC 50818 / BSB-021) TaxID=946362 RepID=F2UMU0_SALR5|nr:uncharacterized protein PTSG_09134 [Salpingoeca rosetta]EGD78439.1 hypothetical protein PTSG_09134 [Salpingoeca rosetta]|eukprot:XP_004989388.1 hypothetical protein PTSG_09134 [Salpingoeca rosetta]